MLRTASCHACDALPKCMMSNARKVQHSFDSKWRSYLLSKCVTADRSPVPPPECKEIAFMPICLSEWHHHNQVSSSVLREAKCVSLGLNRLQMNNFKHAAVSLQGRGRKEDTVLWKLLQLQQPCIVLWASMAPCTGCYDVWLCPLCYIPSDFVNCVPFRAMTTVTYKRERGQISQVWSQDLWKYLHSWCAWPLRIRMKIFLRENFESTHFDISSLISQMR